MRQAIDAGNLTAPAPDGALGSAEYFGRAFPPVAPQPIREGRTTPANDPLWTLAADCPHASGSSVNNSWGCDMPRSAYRPTEMRRRLTASTFAKAEDVRTGRSTERHIAAIRLTSFTAGPMTVKSSRSRLPILP